MIWLRNDRKKRSNARIYFDGDYKYEGGCYPPPLGKQIFNDILDDMCGK